MHFANSESFWTFVLYFSIAWILVGMLTLPWRRNLSGGLAMIGHEHGKFALFLVVVCWLFWPVAPWAVQFAAWVAFKSGIVKD